MPVRSAGANVTLRLLMLIMMLLLYHCDTRPFGNCRADSAADNQQHSAIMTACTSTVLAHRLATLDDAATSKTATTHKVPTRGIEFYKLCHIPNNLQTAVVVCK